MSGSDDFEAIGYRVGSCDVCTALERDIIGLGVAEKQTGRARQVFEKSAEQAGYFEHGKLG